MYRKKKFVVEVEQVTVDGCGNETKPITEGMVRRAVEKLDDVNSVRVNGCPKYAWMVTVDSSTDGYYQSSAYSKLFKDKVSADMFVKEEIMDLVVNGPLKGRKYTEEELEMELAAHAGWVDDDTVHYHDFGGVVDFRIKTVALPSFA